MARLYSPGTASVMQIANARFRQKVCRKRAFAICIYSELKYIYTGGVGAAGTGSTTMTQITPCRNAAIATNLVGIVVSRRKTGEKLCYTFRVAPLWYDQKRL